MALRICKVCSLEATSEADLELFKKTSHCKYGRCNLCKKCEYAQSKAKMSKEEWEAEKARKAEWRKQNSSYWKEWRKENHEHWKAKHSSYQAKRRAIKKQAIPSWFDKEEVQYIYKLAQERGLVVDHIVPLNHPDVCGLHVQDNLRCINKEWNLWKSNKLLEGVRNGL